MRKKLLVLLTFLGAGLLCGCVSGSRYDETIADPMTEMIQNAVRSAIQDALTNPRFQKAVQRYKNDAKNTDEAPIIKVAQPVLDTDDPDNQENWMNVASEILLSELERSNQVTVSAAEGIKRIQAVAQSRKLCDDENMAQETVAKTGTIKAAVFVLRCKIISNEVREGGRKANHIIRTFTLTMEIADIGSGMKVWSFVKQFGTKQSASLIGK